MDIIDISIIDEVRDALGDAAYRGYAARMFAEMHDLGPVMARHLAADAREELAQTAHRAAGSAVSVGARGLHGRLKAIEDAARAGRGGLDGLVAGFADDLAATEAAIDALFAAK